MMKILILPAAIAIVYGLLLLFAPSVIKSIILVNEKRQSIDEWVLNNKAVVGLACLVIGAILLVAAFI